MFRPELLRTLNEKWCGRISRAGRAVIERRQTLAVYRVRRILGMAKHELGRCRFQSPNENFTPGAWIAGLFSLSYAAGDG